MIENKHQIMKRKKCYHIQDDQKAKQKKYKKKKKNVII